MNQLDHYYKVKKNDVSFICTYLEAFEGMSAIRTPNPKFGEETILHIMVSPDYIGQFDTLVSGLATEVMMERTEP